MAIEPTGMQSLLARLEAARASLANAPERMRPAAASSGGAKAVDFGALIRRELTRVDQAQNAAMGLAERFQVGDPKVSLEETMVSLAKANLSFQQMVQVRNRVIQAYHDVMNMQV
jgi:flagellar hook-basal body complex protein FliE